MLDLITLATIALSVDVVGVILLGNALGIRQPRRLLQQHFGVHRPQPLRAVLEQLRSKAEIFAGFLLLMTGFALQVLAALAQPPASGAPPAGVGGAGAASASAPSATDVAAAFALLALAALAATAALRAGCRSWSRARFRRLLSEFFAAHPEWRFDKHPAEVREVGELLGVATRPDDSIGDYVARVRGTLGLPADAAPAEAPDDAFAPVRRVGADRRL